MKSAQSNSSKFKNILASVLAFIGVALIICCAILVSPVIVGAYVIYNIVQEAVNPNHNNHARSGLARSKSVAVNQR